MKTYIAIFALIPGCLHAQEIPVEPAPPTPKPTQAPVQIVTPVPTAAPTAEMKVSPTPQPAVLPSAPPSQPLQIIATPIPVQPAATPAPVFRLEQYSQGNFPETGIYYHPQQLAGIGASHPANAWLVGQFRIVGYEDDHHLTLQTGAAPRSIGQPGLDLLGAIVHQAVSSHLVTVHVSIVEPRRTFDAGTLVQYNRSYPLKIVRLETDGNRIVVEAVDVLKDR